MDTMALLLERGLSSDLEASLIRILTFVMFVFSLMLLAEGSEAPYGRYARQYKGGCSYPLNARVGWFVQEIPAFVMPILCLLLVNVETSKVHNGLTVNRVLLGGLIAHYINRSLIYPWLIRGNSPITCLTLSFGIVINVVSGYLHGRYLTAFATYSEEWLYHPCFISGIVLFFIGMAVNIHADHLLRILRSPGETGYKIPRGGLFEYISAANFFAEIIEWIGYGLASWSLVGLILPLLTMCNLLPRGVHHHRYYHDKFEDYPKDRKAVIPFVL